MNSPVAHTHQSGFTLIELLMYTLIVGTLLTGISVFFGMAADARIKNQSVAEVDQQGLFAMEYMTGTIRNASSITSPALGASGASLTLVVPTGSLSPTIFDLSSNVLRVKEGAAAVVPLTSGDVQITSLTFNNLSRSSTLEVVQIIMTIAHTNTAGRNEYDYQKTFTTSVTLRQ